MNWDILVIGAGVLGLSSAFHLLKRHPGKKIVIIDSFGSPCQGNSAKSMGGYRDVFTSETNYMLAESTIDWFIHLEEDMGYDLIQNIGYLWLFTEELYGIRKQAFRKIESRGVEMKFIDREELELRIPEMVADFGDDMEAKLLGIEPVQFGILGKNCGSIDPDALCRIYERKFLKLGGEIKYSTEAKKLILKPVDELQIPGEPFSWQEKHISGAETNRGEIRAETTVVAAGAWSERLLDPIGVESFMRPQKRQVFVFKDSRLEGLLKVDGLNKYGTIPQTILPKSIIFRPELSEGTIWLGCAEGLGRAFGLEDDPQAEKDFYINNVYPVLVKYFPCFENVRPMNMWAGQYAFNSCDGIPVVAREEGMIYVGAATGCGIMKSDALGRIVAALYKGEEEAELYGGRRFRVADLGIRNRRVEREIKII